MQTTGTSLPAVLAPLATGASSADSWTDTGIDWIQRIVAVLTVEPVAHLSRDTLLAIGRVVPDSVFATLGLVATVTAFSNCLENGFASKDALIGLLSGVSAASAVDRLVTMAVGVGAGIGHYGVVTGWALTSIKLVTLTQQGDVPGALLAGAKLAATIALTGHPVVLGVVIAADVAYTLYWAYFPVDSQQLSVAGDGYMPMKLVPE
ncbi:hypothetical protein BOTU111921_19205 [Bordetella tumbae]|uniref:hypothetical protein n=1 Tax=Bordetella tumbae TaxID=1649139 RepID=UPI0039EF1498